MIAGAEDWEDIECFGDDNLVWLKQYDAIYMISAFSAVNQVVLGQVKTANKSNEIKHYIRSEKLTAKALLDSMRVQWSIEHQMYWRSGVGFKEDEFRIGREQIGETLAVIRYIALN